MQSGDSTTSIDSWSGAFSLGVAVNGTSDYVHDDSTGNGIDSMGLLQLVGAGVINGAFSASLTVIGFFLAGTLLGITTSLQLHELARPTQPLLRRLLMRAPGTYHHSLMVSNLAAGDGGFVASFSDGTVTDASWKARTFYIAPIDSPSNVRIVQNVRDTSKVSVKSLTCKEDCFAAHWSLPKDWIEKDFDDSSWPSATVYTNDTIGVKNKPAYMNFTDLFIGKNAKFIWSSNVVLDNHVIVRKTVK